jgi:hypothetical protein
MGHIIWHEKSIFKGLNIVVICKREILFWMKEFKGSDRILCLKDFLHSKVVLKI